jgi:hypothetical protein
MNCHVNDMPIQNLKIVHLARKKKTKKKKKKQTNKLQPCLCMKLLYPSKLPYAAHLSPSELPTSLSLPLIFMYVSLQPKNIHEECVKWKVLHVFFSLFR